MATDVRRLRAGELCRLLNSTPMGERLGERQLHRHRTRAGLRIGADGDPNRIDLLRYVAWLFDQRHAPERAADASPDYEAHRERARLRNAMLSLSGRDIGALPEVQAAERKAKAKRDFRFFCETYLRQTFHLTWSPAAFHPRDCAFAESPCAESGNEAAG